MKLKQITILSAIFVSASLSSCIVPNSQDPVGDSFSRTGDAFGKVINGVVGQPQQQSAQQTPQQNYPQPQPYNSQQ